MRTAPIALKRRSAKHSKARLKPLQFLAAVERGYTNRLGADPRYAGLIAKNPVHSNWLTKWAREEPYSLSEMADWLFVADTRFDAKPEVQFGAGRTITIFDELRHFACRDVRAFLRTGSDYAMFYARLEAVAQSINRQFEMPLRYSELRSIVKSVTKWIWRHFSLKEFAAVQSRRGKAAMAKRWGGKQIAERNKPWEPLGKSRATYYRWKKAGNWCDGRGAAIQPAKLFFSLDRHSTWVSSPIAWGRPRAPGRGPLPTMRKIPRKHPSHAVAACRSPRIDALEERIAGASCRLRRSVIYAK